MHFGEFLAVAGHIKQEVSEERAVYMEICMTS